MMRTLEAKHAWVWLFALVPTSAQAFSTQGWTWPNQAGTPVIFRVDPAGAPGVAGDSDLEGVRSAFATWNNVACSDLEFAEGEWQAPGVVAEDRVNRIFWSDDPEIWTPAMQSTIALTFTFYDANRNITDADMIMNSVYWDYTTDQAAITPRIVDLETVVFHEIGHFFGLDHSSDPAAVMYPQNNKGVARSPATDDVAGFCTLYSNGTSPSGEGGSGAVGSPCLNNGDCLSNLCAEDPEVEQIYCTQPCTANDPTSCPIGYQCLATATGAFCLAPKAFDEICDQCYVSAHCATGLCLEVPGVNFFQPYCTRACDPTPGVQQCPEGYRCQAVSSLGQTGGVCAPNTGVCASRGKGGHNEPCFANGDCKPNHTCVLYYGLPYCYAACDLERFPGQPCDDNTTSLICLPVADKPGLGACYNIATTNQPCIPEVCDDQSVCAFDETGIDSATCYQLCGNRQCPANTQCVQDQQLGAAVCIPNAGFKLDGQVCASDAECESGACRTYSSAQLCTRPCAVADAASCGSGFRCIAPSGQGVGLCFPSSFTGGGGGGEPPPGGFCACDTTDACDAGCACDPECDTGGCSCQATHPSATSPLWALPLFALALLRMRRARQR